MLGGKPDLRPRPHLEAEPGEVRRFRATGGLWKHWVEGSARRRTALSAGGSKATTDGYESLIACQPVPMQLPHSQLGAGSTYCALMECLRTSWAAR